MNRGGEEMKYFFAAYTTVAGEHAYAELGVLPAFTWDNAEQRAIKGRKLFAPALAGRNVVSS